MKIEVKPVYGLTRFGMFKFYSLVWSAFCLCNQGLAFFIGRDDFYVLLNDGVLWMLF